jgi:hypothetical protein
MLREVRGRIPDDDRVAGRALLAIMFEVVSWVVEVISQQ